jgi:hypothetical protein
LVKTALIFETGRASLNPEALLLYNIGLYFDDPELVAASL